MRSKSSLTFITLLALFGLGGCDLIGGSGDTANGPLSKEAIATRDAAPEDVFKGVLAGETMHLLLHDCEVYRVETGAKGEVRWQSVLAPDFYPMWTACQRQSMHFEKGALTVTLGRMAFGAGGCCATGGTYRSTDGRNWKKIAD